MKQYEAVIKIMKENNGYATLGYLYQNVLKVPEVIWKTKTPFPALGELFRMKDFSLKLNLVFGH